MSTSACLAKLLVLLPALAAVGCGDDGGTGGTPSGTGGAPSSTGGAPSSTGGAPSSTGGAGPSTGGAPAETLECGKWDPFLPASCFGCWSQYCCAQMDACPQDTNCGNLYNGYLYPAFVAGSPNSLATDEDRANWTALTDCVNANCNCVCPVPGDDTHVCQQP